MRRILLILGIIIIVGGAITAVVYSVQSLNISTNSSSNNTLVVLGHDEQAFLDNWEVDDNFSIEDGIKFTFVNSQTGEKISSEQVTVDVDNGIRCITGDCKNFTDIFETQTDQQGTAIINFKRWPEFSFGHIKLEHWDCDGSISSYPSDQHLYFTDETQGLTIMCISNE